MNAYYINDNENWDPIYFQVYVVILVLIFVSVVLVGIWLFPKDSATTRAILPWGFLVFAIANFILFFWVFIYLVLIFPSDEVYVERNRFIKYDHEEGKYKKKNKGLYVLNSTVLPLLSGIVGLFTWW